MLYLTISRYAFKEKVVTKSLAHHQIVRGGSAYAEPYQHLYRVPRSG